MNKIYEEFPPRVMSTMEEIFEELGYKKGVKDFANSIDLGYNLNNIDKADMFIDLSATRVIEEKDLIMYALYWKYKKLHRLSFKHFRTRFMIFYLLSNLERKVEINTENYKGLEELITLDNVINFNKINIPYYVIDKYFETSQNGRTIFNVENGLIKIPRVETLEDLIDLLDDRYMSSFMQNISDRSGNPGDSPLLWIEDNFTRDTVGISITLKRYKEGIDEINKEFIENIITQVNDLFETIETFHKEVLNTLPELVAERNPDDTSYHTTDQIINLYYRLFLYEFQMIFRVGTEIYEKGKSENIKDIQKEVINKMFNLLNKYSELLTMEEDIEKTFLDDIEVYNRLEI